MSKATIFICHCTKTPRAREYLDAVKAEFLRHERFIPHLDEDDPRPGRPWRERLFEWMDKAHGAVLIFSEDSRKSDFVSIELSILSFLRCREQEFPLIPINIDGQGPPFDLEGALGDLGLDEIGWIHSLESTKAAQAALETMGDEIKKCSQLRTPMEVMEDNAVKLLRRAGVTPEDVNDIWEETGGGEQAATPREDCLRTLARRLLADFDGGCEALRKVVEYCPNAKSSGLRSLLYMIAPIWVAMGAAAPIAGRALSRTANHRLIGIDALECWTAQAFISRSGCCPLYGKRFVCELQPPDRGDVRGAYKEQILDKLRCDAPDREEPGEEVLKGTLQFREERQEPAFVVFPRGFQANADVIRYLRQEFPTPMFVFLSDQQKLRAIGPEIHCLADPVPPQRENQAYVTYYTIKQNIEMSG